MVTYLLISSRLPEVFTLYLSSLNVCWFLFAALHWHGLHLVGSRIHLRAGPLTHVFSHHMIPPWQFSKHDMEGVHKVFFSLHVTQDESCGSDSRLHGHDE